MKILSFDIEFKKRDLTFKKDPVESLLRLCFFDGEDPQLYKARIQGSWNAIDQSNLKSIPRQDDIEYGGTSNGNEFYLIKSNPNLSDKKVIGYKVFVLSENQEFQGIISLVLEKIKGIISKKLPWQIRTKPIYNNHVLIYVTDDGDDIIPGINIKGSYQRKARGNIYKRLNYIVFSVALFCIVVSNGSAFLISFGASGIFWVLVESLIRYFASNNIVLENIENVLQVDANLFVPNEEEEVNLESPDIEQND